MAPSTRQILTLYKQLLSKAQKFDNYNFREYAKRRVQDAFKEHKNLKEEDKIVAFFNEGVDNLALLNRQTVISQMYTTEKLVVEPLGKH